MRLELIDKLEVRVPAKTRFTPYMEDVLRWHRDLFRHSRFYLSVADLRILGIDALLHYRAQSTRDHKIELIDTGVASYSQMLSRIERLFEADAKCLEIMRIDLAADLENIPVHAFKGNVRAKWKRSAQEIGKYSAVGKIGVETFTLGKRPNLYRFYDKIAELRHQYASVKRRSKGYIASFEELYGVPDRGLVLTRAERQIGGGRVPDEIATVGQLVNLPNFDPFDRLEIFVGSATEPNPESMDFSAYLQGLGYRDFVQRHGGFQNATRLANKLSNGNAARFAKKYSTFLSST